MATVKIEGDRIIRDTGTTDASSTATSAGFRLENNNTYKIFFTWDNRSGTELTEIINAEVAKQYVPFFSREQREEFMNINPGLFDEAEKQRQADEKRQAEELQRQTEERRLAEEQRQADEKRQAEELQRQTEEKPQTEELQRQTDEKPQTEEEQRQTAEQPTSTPAKPFPYSMHVLSGFIAAIGVTAVAVGFLALNAASFGIAGFAVAAIAVGATATLAGVGLFAVASVRSYRGREAALGLDSPKEAKAPAMASA